MTNLAALVSHARGREPDYSPAFTARVSDLAARLSTLLDVSIRHDSRMNYRVCQMLELFVSDDSRLVPKEAEAANRLKIAISALAPAWTVLASRRGDRPSEWTPTSAEEVWARLGTDVRSVVVGTMEDAGLHHVREAELDRWVEGAVTDMDGVPANVREFLFCELC